MERLFAALETDLAIAAMGLVAFAAALLTIAGL